MTDTTTTPPPARGGARQALRWVFLACAIILWWVAVESTYNQYGLLISAGVGIEFSACILPYMHRAMGGYSHD